MSINLVNEIAWPSAHVLINATNIFSQQTHSNKLRADGSDTADLSIGIAIFMGASMLFKSCATRVASNPMFSSRSIRSDC